MWGEIILEEVVRLMVALSSPGNEASDFSLQMVGLGDSVAATGIEHSEMMTSNFQLCLRTGIYILTYATNVAFVISYVD